MSGLFALLRSAGRQARLLWCLLVGRVPSMPGSGTDVIYQSLPGCSKGHRLYTEGKRPSGLHLRICRALRPWKRCNCYHSQRQTLQRAAASLAICAYGQSCTPRCRIRGDAREQHHLHVYHAITTVCPLAFCPLATPPHLRSKATTPHHWIAHALWSPTTSVAPTPLFLPLAVGDSVAGCWIVRAMPALPGACCPIRAELVPLTSLGWCPPRFDAQRAAPGHRPFCLRRDLGSVGALRSVPVPVCAPSSSCSTDD